MAPNKMNRMPIRFMVAGHYGCEGGGKKDFGTARASGADEAAGCGFLSLGLWRPKVSLGRIQSCEQFTGCFLCLLASSLMRRCRSCQCGASRFKAADGWCRCG